MAAQLGAAFGQAQEAHAPAHSRAIARQKVAPVLHQRLRCCRNAAIIGYGVASKSTSPIVQSRCGAPTPLMRVRGRRSWLCFSCGFHLAEGASASGGPACAARAAMTTSPPPPHGVRGALACVCFGIGHLARGTATSSNVSFELRFGHGSPSWTGQPHRQVLIPLGNPDRSRVLP